ncbi:Predicted chitinase [Nitrosomonas marina]|uniref:Predicted chitinase n=1 Tax=Nitrosomonas marina TaxID=917 RepID=A0A1I0E9E3_9PROT|nr:glycoside hydrolase family 19 protein [Nitrosomonas marina]SET41334.1 Predicted chitinase [Nitrosomonas marina]
MLKSDNKGFLIGEPVDIKKTMETWQNIRNDIRDIKSKLFGDGKGINVTAKVKIPTQTGAINRATERQKKTAAALPLPARSEQTVRDSGGRRYDSAPSSSSLFDEMAQSKPTATPTARKRSFVPKRDDATATPERDEKGRFVSKKNNDTNSKDDAYLSHDKTVDSSTTADMDGRFISSAAEKIASAVADASSGLEDTDPTVKAFGEVAQPIARGYQIFSTGSGKEQKRTDRWFRRIFGEIKLFRKEETTFSKVANQRLKSIEEKPVTSGGGGFLTYILGAGIITAIIGAVAKRIPGMAALFTGAKSIFDLYSGFSDDDLETGDRNKKIVRGFTGTTGILAGAYAGGKAGAAVGSLAGPAGTAAGGVLGALGGIFLGDMAGRNAGEYLSDIIGEKFDIKDELAGAWNRSLSTMEDQFNSLMNKFGSMFDSISNKISSTWNSLTESIKDKFGIDVKGSISKGVDAVKNSSIVKSIREKFSSITQTDKDWTLGQTSRMLESGREGAGAISTGDGDFGGPSYGTYQLSSNRGTLQGFLGSTEYGQQFSDLKPGTDAFNKKWREIAENDPDFGKAQHNFIRETHFDPQMEKLASSGIDLSERGKAVQDAVFSTAVQFGGNTSVIQKSLEGRNVDKMSDADIITAVQDFKIKNNDPLFKSSSRKTRKSTLNRAKREKGMLLDLVSEASNDDSTGFSLSGMMGRIFGGGKSENAERNEAALVRQMDRAGITDPKERAMFMAQMSHESAGFTQMEESFNYRSPDRIMEVSKTAKSKGRAAIEQAMAQGPEAVAEIMYGGRMGNVNPGDAYKFRGRGHTQLTGRNNYEAASKDLGIDLVKYPDLASKPEMAAKISAWYWQKNNLGEKARTGDVSSVTRGINGGLNGLDDRQTKYASYMASLQAPNITTTQTVSAPTPVAPKIPAMQHKIPDAPSISEQLTSGSGKRNQQPIVINSNEVGQDVKDRRIAHVVTGGLSD